MAEDDRSISWYRSRERFTLSREVTRQGRLRRPTRYPATLATLMEEKNGEKYLKPYRDAVKKFGPGFEATLWNSREAQVLRFDVIIDLADFDECVVLDAGCGPGDLAARLIERNVAFTRYVGIDAMAEMIETAQARQLERCEFRVADLLSVPAALSDVEPDYICISGTLNTMDEDAARRLVSAAFEATAQGVIFNFLSDRPHPRHKGKDLTPASRFDTVRWIEWALGRSSRVSFTQAYLDGHDATIMIQHDGQRDEAG